MQYKLDTILDAVNLVLRALGEPPLSSLNTQYPTLDLVLPAIDQAQRSLLTEGWWFNKFEPVPLHPDQNNRVTIPPDTLVFEPYSDQYLFTGEYVRNLDGSLDITSTVRGARVANLPYEELPQMVRTAVAYSAAMSVYVSDVGVDDIYQYLQEQYAVARREMGAAHTRQRNYTTRHKRQVQRWKQFLRS